MSGVALFLDLRIVVPPIVLVVIPPVVYIVDIAAVVAPEIVEAMVVRVKLRRFFRISQVPFANQSRRITTRFPANPFYVQDG